MRWAWLAVVAALFQQTQGTRANWPCGARIDPTYFHLAEATGGSLLLVAPWELADAGELLAASDRHSQTIFRLGGIITAGPHEFRVPIDPSVESVMFSISLQCLQTSEVVNPSGDRPSGDGVTDFSNFAAQRMVIVTKPAAGVWTIRVAGSGLAGVMVKARSELGIAGVQFAPPGASGSSPVPASGVENLLRIAVSGRPAQLEAALVNAASKDIAALSIAPSDDGGTYVSRFTPGPDPFRVLIRGRDPNGAAFQRVHPLLLTAR